MKNIMQLMAFFAIVLQSTFAFAWHTPVPEPYTVTNGYWDCARMCYHLGTDLVPEPLPGMTDARDVGIMSICSGTVVEVTYRTQPYQRNYGGRVLIECDTAEYGTIVAFYGHLGPNTQDGITDDIFVSIGDWVNEGDVIGRLGTQAENSGFIPHLHLGTHLGPYLGAAYECGGWTYAGYTAQAYTPENECACAILDNWVDPMEVLGLAEKELRIVDGSVTPGAGEPNVTRFTWSASAVGGRGQPVLAHVYITNPVSGLEYPFVMEYVQGSANPFQFEYSGRPVSEGTYQYRYSVSTCADSDEWSFSQIGPVVSSEEVPEDLEEDPPPPDENTAVCVPETEECDGYDNDCDTAVDENLIRQCSNECNEGEEVCEEGLWSECSALPCPPPPAPPPVPVCVSVREVCDGVDNNCNGRVDENTYVFCSTACGYGQQSCNEGALTECNAPMPQEEVCDNADNDCDGETDEVLLRECVTVCSSSGDQVCIEGIWSSCTPDRIAPEICDGVDNDCNGHVDDNARVSCQTACGSGQQSCTNGALTECNAPMPQEEVCDNADNDCDGETDEALLRECVTVCGSSGDQVCIEGIWSSCTPDQIAPEVCDGVDNDCNGAVDDGLSARPFQNACGSGSEYCYNGRWIHPGYKDPFSEGCNGRDDDCDGETDEQLTVPCTNECGHAGVHFCMYGQWNTHCSGDPCPVIPETCNAEDDDLDGWTDEGLTTPCGNACGNRGTQTCAMGRWLTCNAAACPPPPPPPPPCTPATETCDNRDNNCNEAIDENLSQSCANECGNTGTQSCTAGSWSACNATACPPPPPPPPPCTPSTEVCDNADNDCDGDTDESVYQSCNNECGNQGRATCVYGSWGPCLAATCWTPPPPPTPEILGVTEAPLMTSPAEGHIQEVPFTSSSSTVTLDWESAPNATNYEYEVRYAAHTNSGTLLASGTTAQTELRFTRSRRDFGIGIKWRVRGLNNLGPGPWSRYRILFFSYQIGSVVQCGGSSCPQEGAWYQISRDRYDTGNSGEPVLLIADWVSSSCNSGRTAVTIPYEEMSGYQRSARYGGCP